MNPMADWRWRALARARRAAARRAPGALGQALSQALPSPRTPVRRAPLLAVDLEMTGLEAERDQIVSIGWVALDARGILLARAGRVDLVAEPDRGVGSSATIHGIRDCDRIGGMDATSTLLELADALGGRVAVFHHAPLDLAFLSHAFKNCFELPWLWPSIDTLAWFRARQLRRHDEVAATRTGLDAARAHHGLAARGAHDALADALSCAELALVLAAHSGARLGDIARLPHVGKRRGLALVDRRVPAGGKNR